MTPRRTIAILALLLAAAVALNVYTTGLARSWDLTEEGSATLSESTRRVVRSVGRRIDITAFYSRDSVGRVEAATLLSRYRKANRRITYRIVDPTQAPGEVQRLGVTEEGNAAVVDVADPDKVEIAQYVIEIDITSAIARLLRGNAGTACFTTGHGERETSDDSPVGLGKAVRLLRNNGYEIDVVDLLVERSVPRHCTGLVVAAPDVPLPERAVEAVQAYLRRSGKAFVMADPESAADLTPLVSPWGIRFIRGVVAEGDADSHLPGDVTAPIIRRYSAASPAVRGLGPTFFPGMMEVEARDVDDPGLSVGSVAMTSELAYLDRDDPAEFDPDVDREGPVSVAVAADDSEVADPGTSRARILRTRILATGDVDFASNLFFEEASNAKLWIQGMDWLTQPEDVVTAIPSFPKVRELKLTEARSRYILMLMAGIVPGLFLIAGGLVWVLRRGR